MPFTKLMGNGFARAVALPPLLVTKESMREGEIPVEAPISKRLVSMLDKRQGSNVCVIVTGLDASLGNYAKWNDAKEGDEKEKVPFNLPSLPEKKKKSLGQLEHLHLVACIAPKHVAYDNVFNR